MSVPAVHAHGLGKRYRLGQVENGFHRLRRRLTNAGPQGHSWALHDVSFEVAEGTTLAVVGRNGAGKSTLLKLLSRITEPTAGYADIAGRVAALLEIGTGFHGELTGRENVYLNGSILGMTRAEVRRKFDEIVAFADVEKYIDTPVKWYSSGMYVRLGFAVAAHLEPEILIVDEVLSVGDAEFQKKCLGRMDVAAQEGRTVLFVSHNMQAVRRLCSRSILLEGGELTMEGPTEDVVRRYLSTVTQADIGRKRWPDPGERPGREEGRLVEARVVMPDGEVTTSFFADQPVDVVLEFDVEKESELVAGIELTTADGVVVFSSFTIDDLSDDVRRFPRGRNAVRCRIPAGLLNSGRYLVTVRLDVRWSTYIAREENVLHFDVMSNAESLFLHETTRRGVVAPPLEWGAVEPVTGDELGPTFGSLSLRP